MDDLSLICPAVCTRQIYVTFLAFGFLCGGVVLLLFFLKHRMKEVRYYTLSAVFFVLFLMYSVSVVVNSCGSGCDPDGTFFSFGLFSEDSMLTSPFDWLQVIWVVLGGG